MFGKSKHKNQVRRSFRSAGAMGGDLLQRLAKKKGGVVLVIQNTTELTINTLSGSLTNGKPEKSAPMPNIIPPLSQHEVGFYAPQGQWSFGVQGESAFKTRMTLLHDSQHANLERLPAEANWTADLQQNWKADVPQIVLTFMIRETTSAPSSKSSSKSGSTTHKYVYRSFLYSSIMIAFSCVSRAYSRRINSYYR